MEWWAIFLMVVVLITAAIAIVYFILKIYFPYQFATFSYHINTRGHYASNEPPTLATFRSKSEGDIIFTETGCYAKQNLASGNSEVYSSKDEIPVSTDSMILMDGEPDSSIGKIQVGLDLDYDTSELIVLIIQAKDLDKSSDDNKDPSNTELATAKEHFGYYICIDLVHANDAISSAKTRIHDHDGTSPVMFKERFLFKINVPDLTRKIVRFRMVSVSKTSNKHEEIGKSVVMMSDVDIANARRLWLNLKDINLEENSRGELMMSLTYLPTASRITLVIIKAKNLRWKIWKQKTGDVMVSVSLIYNGKKLSKRQTSIKRKARDPIFNESLIFSVENPNENMHLRITVTEVLPTGRMHTIGHCLLGPMGNGSELTHWQQMISNPRRPSAMWHWIYKSTNKRVVNTNGTAGRTSNQTSEDSEGAANTDNEDETLHTSQQSHLVAV